MQNIGSEPDDRSMRDRMLAGELYIADDPELAELSRRAIESAAVYNATSIRQTALRRQLLEGMFAEVGADVDIRPPLQIDYGFNITVGPRTFANFGLMALDVARITIGADVQIGPHVQLLTPTHPVDPDLRRDKWEAAKPITVGDNVWLGGGVVVCPGVTIGANTVVGAGAVVTKDLPANVVAVGNPARVIKSVR